MDWLVEGIENSVLQINGVEIYSGKKEDMPPEIKELADEFTYLPTEKDWQILLGQHCEKKE